MGQPRSAFDTLDDISKVDIIFNMQGVGCGNSSSESSLKEI